VTLILVSIRVGHCVSVCKITSLYPAITIFDTLVNRHADVVRTVYMISSARL